jgi:hypothetical protein
MKVTSQIRSPTCAGKGGPLRQSVFFLIKDEFEVTTQDLK